MSRFLRPEAAESTLDRLERLTGFSLRSLFEASEQNPAPDLALTNLERWLAATSSPSLYVQQLLATPARASFLLFLLGTSQHIADTLIQNPEFATFVFEDDGDRVPNREELISDGRRLTSASTSYRHALDRIRYLRQKWNLITVINDLGRTWAQAEVWRSISVVADACITLAVEVAWREFATQKGIEGECPVMVVAYGKLAGSELNYSSDIDLVYVTEQVGDERHEKELTRFCEMLTRAMSDRMGRGSLYRVDLRLRPYGGAGPVVRAMGSYESYYERYAEPWEVQALVRTRPICGSPTLATRWENLRKTICFKPKLSEMGLAEMVAMRDRIETLSDPDDLKRGAGGIRDVEFLTQIFQLLHGHGSPDIQDPNTLTALGALEAGGWMGHAEAHALATGYIFLRELEHRIQFVDDRQTHRIPESATGREAMARLMGITDWRELEGVLEVQRRTIHTLYRSILKLDSPASDTKADVEAELGSQAPALRQWFEVLPESQGFYAVLADDPTSLDRVKQVIDRAPRLISYFRNSVALTEQLLSGEIEDNESDVFGGLDLQAPSKTAAHLYASAYVAACAREVLHQGNRLASEISQLTDRYLQWAARRIGVAFDVVGLGSLGSGEAGPASDADLLFLVSDSTQQRMAEAQASQFLTLASEMSRLGAPLKIDLRLRPDGGRGLLVRSHDAFRHYDSEGMELWERFALGNARLIYGDPASAAIALESAYRLPLTPERAAELVRMKRRIETERVLPQHVRRNVKLGLGGLSDIEWLVHLHEMRYQLSLEVGRDLLMDARIRNLGRAGLMNALEVEALQEAHAYLLDVRQRLYLLGQSDDLVPENPDRLDRLAESLQFVDGNAFLAHHEKIIDAVRRLYLEALERLRA